MTTPTPEPYTFDLPPRPDQLQAIGMVAVEWSYLESVMDVAIGNLASIHEQSSMEALTVHLPTKARLDMLATLFHLKCDRAVDQWFPTEGDLAKKRAEFEQIKRSINSLATKRNEVVHSRWVVGVQGSPLTYAVQARGRLKRTIKGVPAAEMLSIAQQIQEQSRTLIKFFEVLEDDLEEP